MHRRQLLRSALILLGIALLLVACGDPARPEVDDWQRTWDEATSLMPKDLVAPLDRDTCNDALGDLRSIQGDLFPTPDLAIDEVVRLWVSIAEDALFECPPAGEELPNMEYAIGELDRLEAEVAVILEIDSGGG